MNKKSIYLLSFFSFTLFIFITEIVYLSLFKGMSDEMREKKIAFLKISSLPDLALSTQSYTSRHRTLSDLFSIYQDDGTLREYTPTSYTISHSHLYKSGYISDEK